jgi:hypothetical protein
MPTGMLPPGAAALPQVEERHAATGYAVMDDCLVCVEASGPTSGCAGDATTAAT